MKKSLIAMTSITYAMKAKNLLNGLKYYCEIQRTPKHLRKKKSRSAAEGKEKFP